MTVAARERALAGFMLLCTVVGIIAGEYNASFWSLNTAIWVFIASNRLPEGK